MQLPNHRRPTRSWRKGTPFEHRSYGDELVKCQRYYIVQQVIKDLFKDWGRSLCPWHCLCVYESRCRNATEPTVDHDTNW